MPDKINILKVCAILTAGTLSLGLAARSAESYAADVAAREKTLAEAIIQNQLEAELKKAEEELRKELEKQEITIVTTSMETKPPVTRPPETTTPETTAATTTETTTAATEPPVTVSAETSDDITTLPPAEDEIVTEFTRGGILPTDRSKVKSRSMFTLTDSEQEKLMNFLIEHYFLPGYTYSENETRPKLKEKKYLAAQMEESIVESFKLVMGIVNTSDITAALSADYDALRGEAAGLRDDFKEKYKDVGEHGEQFAELYEDGLKYFDRLITAIERIGDVAYQYNNAANPLLAIGLITSALNDVIIPEIMDVLEQSFDLVEITQEIYLEGTVGTKLLSREEVRDIIENPGLAFYVIDNE